MKNLEGLLPKKIAEQNKAKDAKKNIRKADKGYNAMTLNLRPGQALLHSEESYAYRALTARGIPGLEIGSL